MATASGADPKDAKKSRISGVFSWNCMGQRSEKYGSAIVVGHQIKAPVAV
jgi:hypothetical protein